MDKLLDLSEVAAVEDLEDVLIQASVDEGLLHLLDDERCLRGWLDNHAVTSKKSWNKRVDEGEVRVL